jgi:D-alanyl-D-alanine carboxypeptidase
MAHLPLHSGDNNGGKEKYPNYWTKKIVTYLLLGLVFLGITATVFVGMEWFSASINTFFTLEVAKNTGALPASLVEPIYGAQAQMNAPVQANTQLLEDPKASVQAPENIPQPQSHQMQLQEIVLGAKSIVSVQIQAGGLQKTLFQKQSDQELPIASLTKLMTALVVLEQYNLSQKVTISKEAIDQEGEQGVLQEGQVLTVKDLLYIMLMESSNRAAYALSEVVGSDAFIITMNQRAQKLGLAHTHFQDTSGLDTGSYSSAKDLMVLTQYLFENQPLFRDIINQKTYNVYLPNGALHHTLENTNELLGQDNIIGGKTGFTDAARGCFMAIQKNPKSNSYVITVILGAEDRFLEMTNILQWVGAEYQL